MKNIFLFVVLIIVVLSTSCIRREYRFFKTDSNRVNDSIQTLLKSTNQFYLIAENDVIELNVYTNKGERIIDPEMEYMAKGSSAGASTTTSTLTQKEQFIIQQDGSVFLPMVGRVNLLNLTIFQADSLLSTKYDFYYKDSYVKTKLVSKRIIVIGPTGAKVIKLESEKVNLIEAIAMYGGITTDAHTDKIRIVRGDLANPDVQIVDLSTVSGLMQAQTNLLPGDIVYIEPIKRVYRETMQDILPAVSLLVSLITMFVLVSKL
jgi:polysaccharide export outer membrane protein